LEWLELSRQLQFGTRGQHQLTLLIPKGFLPKQVAQEEENCEGNDYQGSPGKNVRTG